MMVVIETPVMVAVAVMNWFCCDSGRCGCDIGGCEGACSEMEAIKMVVLLYS